MATNTINKGYLMEEELRNYFLKAGYYVVRGMPVKYDGFDVTDIDLWLYARTSSLSREIAIVDVKNKKTPQAIERIFWVHGLKSVVHAHHAIVATTERRPSIKEFGKKLDILVLDGTFLSKLSRNTKTLNSRITEEEFHSQLSSYELAKVDGDWKGAIEDAKSYLAKGLNFDTCNALFEIANFFANCMLTRPSRLELATRCFYMVCSYIAICIDYIQKDYSFLEPHERQAFVMQGFSFGSMGESGMDNMLKLSMGLIKQFATDGTSTANSIQTNLKISLNEMRTNILAEYFSKNDVGKSLFLMAKELEARSKASNTLEVEPISIEMKSLIACFCDYWGLERRDFLDLIF
jgi:hypothetical protein